MYIAEKQQSYTQAQLSFIKLSTSFGDFIIIFKCAQMFHFFWNIKFANVGEKQRFLNLFTVLGIESLALKSNIKINQTTEHFVIRLFENEPLFIYREAQPTICLRNKILIILHESTNAMAKTESQKISTSKASQPLQNHHNNLKSVQFDF